MGARPVVETRGDRQALVADAGIRQISLASAVAGAFAAFGAFVILAGLTAGILGRAGSSIEIASPWGQIGAAGGGVVAGLLLVAYVFGGYVAGRMARRRGALHGLLTFVVGVVASVGIALLARRLGGSSVSVDNLRGLGLPTTRPEWADFVSVAGIASVAAIFVGSLIGGVLGERWHAKLLRRALDPEVGAEAEARRQAQLRATEAEERRVAAYRRVRTAAPTRTRRVDGDTAAVPVAAGGAVSDDDTVRLKPSRWPGRAAPGEEPEAAATDRPTVQSGARTE